MNKTIATLSVLLGLTVSGAAIAADQLVNKVQPVPAPMAAQAQVQAAQAGYDAAVVGATAQDQGTLNYDNSTNYRQVPAQGFGRGNMMYGNGYDRGYDRGFSQPMMRGGFAGRSEFNSQRFGREGNWAAGWLIGITVVLVWVYLLLGIMAFKTYLKKNDACPMSWWKKRKEVEEPKA